MTGLEPLQVAALVGWATLVGIDLVSFPQSMLSRPLVVGTVAGAIVGDPGLGAVVGAILELFALESMALGAASYPDYGAATVAGVVAGAGLPWTEVVGASVVLALLLATVGGQTLQWLRQTNNRQVQRNREALSAGDRRAILSVQFGGLGRDLARSLILAVVGLAVATLLARQGPVPGRLAQILLIVVVAGGLASSSAWAIASAGRRGRLAWLLGGATLGTLLALSMAA